MRIKNETYEVEQGSAMTIDWQQVRIQAAIFAMKGLISNPDDFTTNQSPSGIAKKSVVFADALVKELKGE